MSNRTFALFLVACGREVADVPPDAPARFAPPVACGTQLPGLALVRAVELALAVD